MKKIIWIAICALFLNSCCKDGESEEFLSVDKIVGEWVYDVPEEGRWEILKFTSSGVFFYSTDDITYHVSEENIGGRYSMSGSNILGTYKVEGTTMNLNITVSQITDYSFTGLFNNIGLKFTYAKLLDRTQIKPKESIKPDYSKLVHANIISYSSHKPKIATVDSNTGEITGIASGKTYIDVITDEGTAVIEVVVFDIDDMFEDYTFALGYTVPEVLESIGEKFLASDDTIGAVYLVDNYVVDTLKFITGHYDNTHVEFIEMILNRNITGTQVINSLKNKYEVLSEDKPIHAFLTGHFINERPVAIVYDESRHLVSFYVLQPSDIWRNFDNLFGKDKDAVKNEMSSLGYKFYLSDYSYSKDGSDYYSMDDSDYAYMVGFVFNPEKKMCEYWVYFDTNADPNDVWNYLTGRYYLSDIESSSDEYVFYDDEHRIRLVFSLYGTIQYTDLEQTPYVSPSGISVLDLSKGIGMTQEQLLSEFGNSPYDISDESIIYLSGNDYILYFMFLFDSETQLVRSVYAVVNNNLDKTDIVEWLSSLYTVFPNGTTDDGQQYAWINSSDIATATVGIIYNVEQGTIMYVKI